MKQTAADRRKAVREWKRVEIRALKSVVRNPNSTPEQILTALERLEKFPQSVVTDVE